MKEQGRFRPLQWVVAVGIAVLGVGLLTQSAAVSQGVRSGLAVCANVLIPSLFPFMVLAGFVSLTDYARILSIPLTPLTTKVYRLPAQLGVVVLLSMVGGYPVGAKMVSGLLEQNKISPKTAQRMLCFCVSSGPSFLITAVGAGLFLNRTAGLILFATQTAATLFIGWAVSRREPIPSPPSRPAAGVKAGAALVMAVSGASGAMMGMCAFAVLFSGLLSMVSASGLCLWLASWLPIPETVFTALLSGLLEVTSGCIAAAKVEGLLAFGLASACVSFSGLSVLFQVMSYFKPGQISFRPLILSKIAHVFLSTAMAVPLYRALCGETSVWLSSGPPAMQTDGKTTLISVCLLAMCAIFTLSLAENNFRKQPD